MDLAVAGGRIRTSIRLLRNCPQIAASTGRADC